jgi:hypothetical protein
MLCVGSYGGWGIDVGNKQSGKIVSYSLIAESQYTTVPEWPSPMLVAGIVISLVAIIIRRKRRLN